MVLVGRPGGPPWRRGGRRRRWPREITIAARVPARTAPKTATIRGRCRDRSPTWASGRGLADNSVGRVIETILKADLVLIDEIGFAPLDDNAAQLLFRLVAAAYERRVLGIGSHWPFEEWGRFLPEHTTAVSLLDRLLHHAVLVPTEGESYRMKQARTKGARPRRSTT